MKGQMAGDLQDMEPESSDEETEVDLEPIAAANSKVTPAAKQQPAAAGAKKTNSKSRYVYNYQVMKSGVTEGGCLMYNRNNLSVNVWYRNCCQWRLQHTQQSAWSRRLKNTDSSGRAANAG